MTMKLYRGDAEEHRQLWSQERGWYYDPPYDSDWPNRKLRRAYPPAVLARLRAKKQRRRKWFAQPRKNEGPHGIRSARVSGPFALRIMWSYLRAEVPPPLWGLPYHCNSSTSGTWLGLERMAEVAEHAPVSPERELLERSLADVRAKREPHVIQPGEPLIIPTDLLTPDGRAARGARLLACGIWAP